MGSNSNNDSPYIADERPILVPVIQGDWWQVTEKEPDLGEYNNPSRVNVCDFAIWQAADGTWQIDACVRQTNPALKGERLFYRWEAQNITDKMWTPCGISLLPRREMGQCGSIQAPFVVHHDGLYYFFYNAQVKKSTEGGSRCAAFLRTSLDGKKFTDVTTAAGSYEIFSMGRDIMVYRDEDRSRWIAYYQDYYKPEQQGHSEHGTIFARTSTGLIEGWDSEHHAICRAWNPESPFIVKHGGLYYLWIQMQVFVSDDPTKFPDEPITQMTDTPYQLYYAPEIVQVGSQYYIGAYSHGALHLAKFHWVIQTPDQIRSWRTWWQPRHDNHIRKKNLFAEARALDAKRAALLADDPTRLDLEKKSAACNSAAALLNPFYIEA